MTNDVKAIRLLKLSLRLVLDGIEDYNYNNQNFAHAIQTISQHPYYVAFRRMGESSKSAMKFAETFMSLYPAIPDAKFRTCNFEPLTKHSKHTYPQTETELTEKLEVAQADLKLVEQRSNELRVKYHTTCAEFQKAIYYGDVIFKLSGK
jgi:hypothetical protein